MALTQKTFFGDDAPDDYTAAKAPRNLRVVPRRDDLLFQSLEYKESRKNAVVMSIFVHIGLLTVLVLIPLFLFDQLNVKRYYPVLLVPPPQHKEVLEVTHWKPVALPKPKPPEPIVAPPRKPEVTEVKLPDPPKPKPKPEEFKLPEVKVQPKPALLAENKRDEMRPEPPKPEVKTNVFGGSTGSSAKPTVDLPAKAVQTGGFGDPNGMKAEGRPDKTPNIGALGSFDLPVGPGAGNGTGGAKGVRGIVTSAGFGNGTATDNPGSGGGGRTGRAASVQKGGFGDLDSPGAATPQARKKESEAPQSAVEITFKPRPDYTEEARKLRVEGEVLVKVLFTASGQVKVLGVTRGLGHGLDENAIKAAEQIRFKPAAREGTPVDSTATVHIVFQLAY